MKWLWLVLALVLVAGLAAPKAAQACPSWKDAIASSGAEDADPLQEATAYNRSIYLMLGMPYLLLTGIGFMVYRSRKTAKPPV